MKNEYFKYSGHLMSLTLFFIICIDAYYYITIGKIVPDGTIENAYSWIEIMVFTVGSMIFYLTYEVRTMNDEIEELKKQIKEGK